MLHLWDEVLFENKRVAKKYENFYHDYVLFREDPQQGETQDHLEALENCGCLKVVLKILSLSAKNSGLPQSISVFGNEELIVFLATVLLAQSISDSIEKFDEEQHNKNPICDHIKEQQALGLLCLLIDQSSSETACVIGGQIGVNVYSHGTDDKHEQNHIDKHHSEHARL